MKKMQIVSLFSGIGGFEKGFEKSKMKYDIVFSSEIDKYAVITYSSNFQTKTMHGDIKEINEIDIPDHDLLCAGFPCQSFSVAGRQKGFNDIRGTLFFDVVRIIKAKKPKYIFLENVKNLISHDNSTTIKTILRNISECGYTFDFTIINSNEVGVPQNRERVYIVGVLNYETEKFICDRRSLKVSEIKKWANDSKLNTMNFFNDIVINKRTKHIIDILDGDIDSKYFINNSKLNEYIVENYTKHNTKYDRRIIKELDLPREIHNDLERQRRVYSIFGISPTLLARSDSPKIILRDSTSYKVRKLTPLETLKIQGFDKKYVENVKKINMSDAQLYKQAGNAVSPPVITEIVNKIMERFYEEL